MKMVFNGSEGKFIDRSEAKEGIENYKKSSNYASNNDVKAFLFGKDKINELLSQKDCLGIRIYYGKKAEDDGKYSPQLYLVGTDKNGNDIISNNKVLDFGLPCPRYCPGGEGSGTSIED